MCTAARPGANANEPLEQGVESPSAVELHGRIAVKFRELADEDAARVIVHRDHERVTLTGTVSSCAQREAAERAAWAISGVRVVHDYISIDTEW